MIGSSRFLITLTRVLAYFSLFYAILKAVAIFGGHWFWPNFILGLVGAIVAYLLFRVIRTADYKWIYAVICIVLFSVIRFYEAQLMAYIYNLLS